MDNGDFLDKVLQVFTSRVWVRYFIAVAIGFMAASFVGLVCAHLLSPINNEAGNKKENVIASAPGGSRLAMKETLFSEDEVKRVLDRNLFNKDGEYPKESKGDESEAAPEVMGKDMIPTRLPLKLAGLIYGGDDRSGLALIENTAKKTMNSFLVGDRVAEKAVLIAIERERVIFDLGDHREFLAIDRPILAMRGQQKQRPKPQAAPSDSPRYATEPPPANYKEEGFERAGTEIVVSSDFRKKMLSEDFAKILQDAKAEPYMSGGELAGFKLTRIRSDSIYEKAGLQNDDIVKEVNGVPLTNTAQAIKLLNSLRGESEIEVRVERGGAAINMTLQVR